MSMVSSSETLHGNDKPVHVFPQLTWEVCPLLLCNTCPQEPFFTPDGRVGVDCNHCHVLQLHTAAGRQRWQLEAVQDRLPRLQGVVKSNQVVKTGQNRSEMCY